MSLLRRPTYPEIASTLALVVALTTGGAYAASLITTADLANNAVTSPKIKNGTVKSADLSSQVKSQLGVPGPQGAPGSPGTPGTTGNQGPRGFSSWDAIPSGQTVTGRIFEQGSSTATTVFRVSNVNLPGEAPAALTDNDINFAADASTTTIDDDSACTGTYTAPTAPAGKVCVYLGGTLNIGNLQGRGWLDSGQQRYAFYVQGEEETEESTWQYYMSWAYTAP